MNQKIRAFLKESLKFFAQKVLLYDLGLAMIVVLSLFIWGPFTTTNLSERLIWAGIVTALVAGILVFAQTSGGRDYGLPGQFTRSAHVQNLIDFNIEVRQQIEGRMGVFPRIFLMGAILFGLGILVQVIFK